MQVLERVIERSDSAAESKDRVVEHEYQRAFELPPEHRLRAFPNYFRVRVGASASASRYASGASDPIWSSAGSFTTRWERRTPPRVAQSA